MNLTSLDIEVSLFMSEDIMPYRGRVPEEKPAILEEAMANYYTPPSNFSLEIGPLLEKWSRTLSPEALAAALVSTFQKTVRSEARISIPVATLRGLAAREHLKEEEGGHISAEQARRFLSDISKTTVLAQYHAGKLLGWKDGRAFRFPLWQFAPDGGLVPGIEKVLEILNNSPVMDDWGKVLFFLNPRQSLSGGNVLHALRKGDSDTVLRLAVGELE